MEKLPNYNNLSEISHNRTIIHIDMDYYYAQVEEILNPSLKSKPVGVQQRNCVVTSNYIARKYGIKKLMTINDAKKLCPQLILVNGEDLTKYKQMSIKIFDILSKYTPLVEKLGLDENYLDVSEIINEKLNNIDKNENDKQIEGCIYPLNGTLNDCNCGCSKRLQLGTIIAKEIRDELYEKLNITCCAGISYNKLLSKLVGSMNKPNNQTVLVSTAAENFMRELGTVKKITGIGIKTELLLKEINITTITDLQNCDMIILKKKLGYELANKLKDLSFGHDLTQVRTTGKPKSIGLEDSCHPISVRKDVEDRFRLLLMRLIDQVSEDGRIPITLKIIIRKYDPIKKTSHRETKQANIISSLFKFYKNQITLTEGAQDKLIKIIMKLFDRIIDMNKPFNITLLGLAFSKFQERKSGPSSIANFLIKKTDLEVQSVTNLKSIGNCNESLEQHQTPTDDLYRRRINTTMSSSSSVVPMHVDYIESSSDISDISEAELEPSPKKTRLGLLIAKRRCIMPNDTNDIASPSKLRVAELRLSSRDSEKDINMAAATTSPLETTITATNTASFTTNITSKTMTGPSSTINDVSNNSDNINDDSHYQHQPQLQKITKDEQINNVYFKENNHTRTVCLNEERHKTSLSSTSSSSKTTVTGNLANIPCPSGVDPTVFKELPIDVQNELITSWRNSLAVKTNNSNNSTNISTSAANTTATAATATATSATKTSNTLHRYFIRNN